MISVRLQETFPTASFAAPATDEQISRAEYHLGVNLPQQLRSLYQQCDGFREPLGNAKYLLALLEEDFIGSLVSVTRFAWQEWTGLDRGYDAKPFIFFGSSSGDDFWAIRWSEPFDLIAYHHNMGGECEPKGYDILSLYTNDFAAYGSTGS